MLEYKRITSKEVDDAKKQFATFLELHIVGDADRFEAFDFTKDRLDLYVYGF